MDPKLKRQIFELVSEDRLAEAIDFLQDNLSLEDPSFPDVILLARRIRELDRDAQSAIIALDDASMARNQISHSLLKLMQQMGKEDTIPAPSPPAPKASSPPVEELKPPSPQTHAPHSNTKAAASLGYVGSVHYDGSASAQQTELTLSLSYDAAFQRCLDVLPLAGMFSNHIDKENGRINGKRNGNFVTSFGENIFFWLSAKTPSQTQVTIVSDSVLPTMVFDWGRSKGNIEKLVSLLQ